MEIQVHITTFRQRQNSHNGMCSAMAEWGYFKVWGLGHFVRKFLYRHHFVVLSNIGPRKKKRKKLPRSADIPRLIFEWCVAWYWYSIKTPAGKQFPIFQKNHSTVFHAQSHGIFLITSIDTRIKNWKRKWHPKWH